MIVFLFRIEYSNYPISSLITRNNVKNENTY